nr:MAG TPA: hypothetical protein [Caudoviricetes sp.]
MKSGRFLERMNILFLKMFYKIIISTKRRPQKIIRIWITIRNKKKISS